MRMRQQPNFGVSSEARICVFSQRQLQRLVSACGDYEFEDLICEFDDADVLTPQPRYDFVVTRKISNQLTRHASVASFNPGVKKLRISRGYELFFAKFLGLSGLLSLNALGKWREHCRVAICWLDEIWVRDVPILRGYSKILSQFDYIILNCSASVQPVQDLAKRPCVYIPPGIDAIKFCPYPDPPLRSIDVYSIGRRSQVTHRALLKMAEQKHIFYVYDTILGMQMVSPGEHRSLTANMAKRSRYFLVNPGKIDRQFETGGQSELGFRYFEGAAAGTVMIGEYPETEVFREHFGWPDAVVHVPFDAPNIAKILADLDSQPARMEQARKSNIVQSLLRHDWAYRWGTVLDMAGLKPKAALIDRLEYLKRMAEDVKKA